MTRQAASGGDVRPHQAQDGRSRLCRVLRAERFSGPLPAFANSHSRRIARWQEDRIPKRPCRPRRNLPQSRAQNPAPAGGTFLSRLAEPKEERRTPKCEVLCRETDSGKLKPIFPEQSSG